MRVQIGNHSPKVIQRTGSAGMQGLREIEEQLSEDILDSVLVESAEVSERWLDELAMVTKEAALQEAGKLFPAIYNLISGRQGAMGFSGSDLPWVRGLQDRTLSPVVRSGDVEWDDLSLGHIMRKQKNHPESVNQMFRYSGRLASYFRNQSVGRNFVTGKLGGVEVKVRPAMLYSGKRVRASNLDLAEQAVKTSERFFNFDPATPGRFKRSQTRGYRSLRELLIGTVTVEIFPRLSTSLLPMLSSNDWTDSGNGDLERHLFPGKSLVGAKLVNKSNPFRPLLTPTLQYWIALQIPDAIMRRVRERFARSSAKTEAFLKE